MENLQVIKHPKFGQLSVIIIDGKEYFKAKECAFMLGYKDTVNAVKQHCKGVVKHHLPSKSGEQTFNLIPEGDLWRLIIRSKLPQAEQIEKWIMDEVLPTIRKTGAYGTPEYEQLKLEDKPYEYVDKFYKGQPVLTSADIEHFSGINHTRIDHALRRVCIEHADYIYLTHSELAEFKKENPKLVRNFSHAFVIFKSGFDKLMKHFGAEVETPKIMIEEKPTKNYYKPSNLPTDNDYITALNVLKHVKMCANLAEIRQTTLRALDIAISFCAIALGEVSAINYRKK